MDQTRVQSANTCVLFRDNLGLMIPIKTIFSLPIPTPSRIPRPINGFRPRRDAGVLVPGWEEFLTAASRRETMALESSNLLPDWCVWPEGSQDRPPWR